MIVCDVIMKWRPVYPASFLHHICVGGIMVWVAENNFALWYAAFLLVNELSIGPMALVHIMRTNGYKQHPAFKFVGIYFVIVFFLCRIVAIPIGGSLLWRANFCKEILGVMTFVPIVSYVGLYALNWYWLVSIVKGALKALEAYDGPPSEVDKPEPELENDDVPSSELGKPQPESETKPPLQESSVVMLQHTNRPPLLDGQPLSATLQWYGPPRRPYSRWELLVDQVLLFVGASSSWLAAIVLNYVSWSRGDSAVKQLCFLAQGIGMTIMLNTSAIYHNNAWNWKISEQLYHLDHIGISCMIMGSYVSVMNHGKAYITLAVVCALGTVGILIEAWRCSCSNQDSDSDFPKHNGAWTFLDGFHLANNFIMSWAGLPVLVSLRQSLPSSAVNLIWVAAIFGTGGLVIFLQAKLQFHIAIWHVCILVLCACFYCVNLLYLVGDHAMIAL